MIVECRRYIVSGRVQGVFFRASAQERASHLRLDGWAKNLPDGRVDVLAQGESSALEQFRDWLREGPPSARVESVQEVSCEKEPGHSGFYIR